MAVGITVAGFGLGVIITPTLAQWLISTLDWRQAYIILGLITLVVIVPLAQFMKHSPQRSGLRPYGENGTMEDKQIPTPAVEEFSLTQVFKTGRFWIFSSIMFCFLFSMQVIFVHIIPHASDVGLNAVVAASVLSIVGGISIIGRLSMGFISDRIGSKLSLSACITLVTLALLWLLFAREVWAFYLFAALFGLAYGGVVPLQTIITAELFGLGSLGKILAYIMLFGLVGGSLGPFLAGSLFDATGSYTLIFVICLILGTIGIILTLTLPRYKLKR